MIPPYPVEEYKVVTGDCARDVTTNVNDHIRDGWVIWGAPYVHGQYRQYQSQAMVKIKQPDSRYIDENHPPDENFPPDFFRL